MSQLKQMLQILMVYTTNTFSDPSAQFLQLKWLQNFYVKCILGLIPVRPNSFLDPPDNIPTLVETTESQ